MLESEQRRESRASTGFSRVFDPAQPKPRPIATKTGALILSLTLTLLLVTGCAASGKPSRASGSQPIPPEPSRVFQDINLPRQVGVVENSGFQIPVISPDGQQMLYVRAEQAQPSLTTLLGAERPTESGLSVFLRPVTGAAPGRQLSSHRWSHSPTWSGSGRAVAYVASEPGGSIIVHVDLSTGQQSQLGLPGSANCLPRFDSDDRTLLFCAGQSPAGPFRIYRQMVGQPKPVPTSPEGMDCLIPVRGDGAGRTLCAQVEGDHLNWVWADQAGAGTIGIAWGHAGRMAALQAWAGIAAPVSSNGDAILFYNVGRDRICVLHLAEKIVRQHRPGTIAGCWVDSRTIVLATQGGAFVTDTVTGQSTQLLTGSWIPCRYVPTDRRLILLGQQTPQFFAIWEIVAKPPREKDPAAALRGNHRS